VAVGEILYDARWGGGPGERRGSLGMARFSRELLDRLPGVQALESEFPVLHPLEPLWLISVLARRRPAVYVSPGYNATPWSPVPMILTVHDLILLRFAEERTAAKLAYFAAIVRPAVRHAARVLTLSEYSKGEIVAWAGVPPEKVVVVGCGVSAAFRPAGPVYHAAWPYLIYAGNRKRHKNVHGLLAALARSRSSRDCGLVLSGPPDDELTAAARSLGIADRVAFLGAVDDSALAAAYRGAIALVFPSLYEGFGLPAAEAMAVGTPVIASRTTGLGETVGDAGILVDPQNEDAIAAAIDLVAEDDALRRELSARGRQRATEYTWERVAEHARATIAEVT